MKKYILICIPILVVIIVAILLIFNNKKEEIVNETNETDLPSTIKILVGDKELIVSLEENRTTRALVEKLDEGNIVINAHDYNNFEKVGDLGFKLSRNDKYITTQPGDVILYNGNQIAIYYDTNTWNFTRIGKIDLSQEELKGILGEGDVTFVITK